MRPRLSNLRAPAMLIDAVIALPAAVIGAFLVIASSLLVRPTRRSGRRMLVLDSAYSLAAIRARELLHSIEVRDLGGFFDHVWSVHPLVGSDPSEPPSSRFGLPRSTRINARHTFVEGYQGVGLSLRFLPLTNLVLAQLALLRTLLVILRRHDISVIRVGDPYYQGLLALFMRRLKTAPVVVRINGNYDAIYEATGRPAYPRLLRSRAVEKWIERRVLTSVSLVVAANEDNLGFALRNGADPKRSFIFPYGNLIHPCHFADAVDSSREADGAFPDPPFLVCVSRLEPVKLVDDFVRILAELRNEGLDVRGLLVGDGSMREALSSLADDLGVATRLTFAGNRPQTWIARALRTATVVVAPMMGRALVESALSGTPIVAYDVDWHSELIEDGITGSLVPLGDTERMERYIKAFLDDPKEATEVGRRARQRVLEKMDPQVLNHRERQVYEALFDSTRSTAVQD